MEDVKTHPIETSALADQSSERANILKCRTRSAVIIPWDCE